MPSGGDLTLDGTNRQVETLAAAAEHQHGAE